MFDTSQLLRILIVHQKRSARGFSRTLMPPTGSAMVLAVVFEESVSAEEASATRKEIEFRRYQKTIKRTILATNGDDVLLMDPVLAPAETER